MKWFDLYVEIKNKRAYKKIIAYEEKIPTRNENILTADFAATRGKVRKFERIRHPKQQ